MDSCNFISSKEGAIMCFEGLSFPANKQDILDIIEKSGGPEAVIVAANQIPDKIYESMDELINALEEEVK